MINAKKLVLLLKTTSFYSMFSLTTIFIVCQLFFINAINEPLFRMMIIVDWSRYTCHFYVLKKNFVTLHNTSHISTQHIIFESSLLSQRNTMNIENDKNTKTTQQTEIEILCKNYEKCSRCPLAQQGRKHIVFGQGNPLAELMFIGEAPGRDEDTHGAPFIGRAGQLLTKIIQDMSLTRDQVYISNVVKCRPPKNRTPLPDEREICKKILFAEIDIIQPKVICLLGATATQALLGNDMKISPARGTFFTFRTILTMPTYHPAYLLRNPSAKKIVWEDMQKIMNALGLPLPLKTN